MAKKKQTKPRKYAPRQTRKFQLRLDHAEDAHVRDVLDFCKGERREVTMIRKGVSLYWALEQGNLDVLFEMFPQYKAQFAPNTAETLEQFMGILRRQQVVQAPERAAGPKQIAAPNFAIPIFEEDDEPTVLIRTSTSTDSSMNFVTALKNMQ